MDRACPVLDGKRCPYAAPCIDLPCTGQRRGEHWEWLPSRIRRENKLWRRTCRALAFMLLSWQEF